MLSILKLVFPSWDFFRRYEAFPVVYVTEVLPGNATVWKPILLPHALKLRHLFYNPCENLRLAKLNVLLALIDEINAWRGEPKKLRTTPYYQCFLRICSQEVLIQNPNAKFFKFKLCHENAEQSEDLFLSAEEGVIWRAL